MKSSLSESDIRRLRLRAPSLRISLLTLIPSFAIFQEWLLAIFFAAWYILVEFSVWQYRNVVIDHQNDKAIWNSIMRKDIFSLTLLIAITVVFGLISHRADGLLVTMDIGIVLGVIYNAYRVLNEH